MFKIGDNVRILKDIIFDCGRVVEIGETDRIYKIDEEGYWLEKKEIFIIHGHENEYMKII